MAFKGKLVIEREEYDLQTFSYSYFLVDHSHLMEVDKRKNPYPITLDELYQIAQKHILGLRPLEGAYGGILNITLESSEKDDLLYYLFNRTRDRGVNFTEGYISVYGQDEYAPIRLIQFKDAFINYISEDFSSTGNQPMMLSLKISAGVVQYDKTVKFKKSWAESDFIPRSVRIAQSSSHSEEDKPEELPLILQKVEWRNLNMQTIEELPYEGEVILYAEILNVDAGDVFEFEIERTDLEPLKIKGIVGPPEEGLYSMQKTIDVEILYK